MEAKGRAGLIEHFGAVEDRRIQRSKRHKRIEIIVIAIGGVSGGADDWVAIAAFGQAKREWVATFLELPNGIPSHDTCNRVFRRLDPEQFQASFLRWVQAVFHRTKGQVVAVDGKTLCSSSNQAEGHGAIHMVSAWANENQLVLGHVKVAEKSNEIPAISARLKLLDISGCIVTVEAMGGQKAIAPAIVAGGANDVLAVKENQATRSHEREELFDSAERIN